MSKLYIFGIGGTGARVVKSLTLLLASGVELGQFDSVVPVFIDTDTTNGNLTETITLLQRYADIRSHLSFEPEVKSRFFKTRIEDGGVGFRLPVGNVGNSTFAQYVDLLGLDMESRALMSLLFSDRNLASTMEMGFKGNPNMGSIVLNDFCNPQNNALSDLLQNFADGDRIFIISSIFGGTGAAGFPLLLKTLREASQFNFANPAVIANAPIGAISVQPYFGVQSDAESQINMATFVSKTTSALRYYEENIDADALYYVADSMDCQYENHEGNELQRNDAHFVELAAALAIVDFARSDVHRGDNIYKEFATAEAVAEMNLSHLSVSTKAVVSTPLAEFYMFARYFQHHLRATFAQPWAKQGGFNEGKLSENFYKQLALMLDYFYDKWLRQMASNHRSFKPFVLTDDPSGDLIFNAVQGYEPQKLSIWKKWAGKKGWAAIDTAAADVSAHIDARLIGSPNYFMSVFWQATHNAMAARINLA